MKKQWKQPSVHTQTAEDLMNKDGIVEAGPENEAQAATNRAEENTAAYVADQNPTPPVERLPDERPEYRIERVGSIAYGPGGPYSGCKMVQFTTKVWRAANEPNPLAPPEGVDRDGLWPAYEQVNHFFRSNFNLHVCDSWVSHDGETVTLMITNTLTEAQRRVITLRAKRIEEEVQNEMEAEREANEAQMTADVAAQKELERLADIGRKCANNHGAIAKQLKAKLKK